MSDVRCRFFWGVLPGGEGRLIAIAREREVLRLLAEGRLTQRKIALEVGVSRGFVQLMARLRRVRPRRPEGLLCDRRPGPIERCPGCGAMAEMPCRACLIRANLRRKAIRLLDGNGPRGLDLKLEHRERYEQVRRGRFADGNSDEYEEVA